MKFIFITLFTALLLSACQRKTAAVAEDSKSTQSQPAGTKSPEKAKTTEINTKASRVQQDLSYKEAPIQSSGSLQEALIKNHEQQSDYKALYESGYQKHNAGDFSGAIADFSQSISLNPQFADAWNFRAQSRYKSGDKEGACSDWNKAKELGYAQAERAIGLYCK